MHLFRSGKGQSQMAQDQTDPMQLIRTRSASDRFPAFSKAASRSQVFIDSQRIFNRSMSAQESEEKTERNSDYLRSNSKPVLQSLDQDEKENIYETEMYHSELSWVDPSPYANSNKTSTSILPPLLHAKSMNDMNSKKQGLDHKESSCTLVHRSPLRERRQKSPLTIKAPAPTNFKRPRAKSSASFGTIHSPPPCPPPTTPLPELPLSTNSSTSNRQAGQLTFINQHLQSSSMIAKETPFEQAWRSNHETMEQKANQPISSALSSCSPSPISSEGDTSSEVNVLQLQNQDLSLQRASYDTKSNLQDDLLFQKLGLSSFDDQLNWGQIPAVNTLLEYKYTLSLPSREWEVNDDNCVYGLAI